MKLASAVAAGTERRIARAIAPVRVALREGRSLLCCFDQPIGTTRLDLLGPHGMIGGSDDGFLVAPVPTLRLWSPTATSRPIAIAAANKDFPEALDALARRATPLVGDELPMLLALLAVVREETAGMRFRIPGVGDAVTASGRPGIAAWASALSLADIQAAVLKAVA
ncbi:MAG: hypothetical protein FJ102_13300 [Deltaproteobacteria bacterium]|nr:hypothetical protein [Deltaproteobacteria bacterium]